MIIAALAEANDCVVVTENERLCRPEDRQPLALELMGVVKDRSALERSGLACGFGHGRFACGNLQANGMPPRPANRIG